MYYVLETHSVNDLVYVKVKMDLNLNSGIGKRFNGKYHVNSKLILGTKIVAGTGFEPAAFGL